MDTAILVAIISAAATVIVAIISSALTKRSERRDALQVRKLEHYRELLSAISDLAIDGVNKDEADVRFCRAANTIAIVAPQEVIAALMDFHEEVRVSNTARSLEGHDEKLKRLLLQIRKSLELPFKDEPAEFQFHLIGSRPPKNSANASQ